jgi:hypothetical protein
MPPKRVAGAEAKSTAASSKAAAKTSKAAARREEPAATSASAAAKGKAKRVKKAVPPVEDGDGAEAAADGSEHESSAAEVPAARPRSGGAENAVRECELCKDKSSLHGEGVVIFHGGHRMSHTCSFPLGSKVFRERLDT